MLGKKLPPMIWPIPAFALAEESMTSVSQAPTFEPFGRRPIGVSQMPGQGGWNFPIVFPSADIDQLIADAWLAYEDDSNDFELPFRINWLYGFGEDPVAVPITPVNTHDAEIVDANGDTVFNTLDGGTFDSWIWADRLLILEWVQNNNVLRIVYHIAWGLEDTPRTYDEYIEPVSSTLDARVVWQYPRRVNTLRVGLTSLQEETIEFQNGYNMNIVANTPNLVDGERRETVITFNAPPGGGNLGRFGPGCDDSVFPPIRRINNIGPADRGNFIMDATGCYRIQRPVQEVLTEGEIRDIQIRNHTLQITNDCGPCCECDDFINVWEAIRRLRNRYAALVADAQEVRDLYHANRERYQKSQDCRLNDRLRVVVSPVCPDELGVAVGYCNNSEDCLQNVVIHMSFQYMDGTSSPCTKGEVTGQGGDAAGDPIAAVTTPMLREVACQSTFRTGNTNPDSNKGTSGGASSSARQFYKLGGEWPHFWAHWDAVEPGGMAAVTFRLRFRDAEPADRVELVADAFSLGGTPGPISGGSPVPGYVPGSGPVSTDPSLHLVDCPKFVSTGLMQEPCCESSISNAT